MSTDVEHTAEKERIIKSYEKSVDNEIYNLGIKCDYNIKSLSYD